MLDRIVRHSIILPDIIIGQLFLQLAQGAVTFFVKNKWHIKPGCKILKDDKSGWRLCKTSIPKLIPKLCA